MHLITVVDCSYLSYYREKEHDLETKFAMLNRELRKMMEIEGKTKEHSWERVFETRAIHQTQS